MFVWVVYDIKIDKIRNRVIKQCKKYGLYRVQKSVFFGDIEQSALASLKILIRYIIDDIEDSVYIFPMTKKHLDEAKFIGLSFDKLLVLGESESIFFLGIEIFSIRIYNLYYIHKNNSVDNFI